MRAREWVLAEKFRQPADYGIPELPAWRICRSGRDGLALADADTDPFIAADNPMKVRR